MASAFPFWYSKNKGKIKVTIDQNASESCPAVKGKCGGCKASKEDYEEMWDTEKSNIKLMTKLDKEIEEFGNCFGTEEFIEGTTAFLEKRRADLTSKK